MKTKKNEEYMESQITIMSVFGFPFFIKSYILLENIIVKGKKVKSSLYHHILFTVFMRCRIFETHSPKLNIHKYNNYNIIEIYINRLSLTMQIFLAMDCLILMSETYLHFRKNQKHLPRNFFPPRRLDSCTLAIIFWVMCISKICTKT